MESDIIWNIWRYFITYVIWMILGIELAQKYFLLRSIKSNLGNDYNTYPNLSISKKWRTYFAFYLILISLFMIILALINSKSPFYVLPILIIAGLVYINRHLKFRILNFESALFYNDRGFVVYPDKFRLFSCRYYEWNEVESIELIAKKSNNFKANLRIKDRKRLLNIKYSSATIGDGFIKIIKAFIKDV